MKATKIPATNYDAALSYAQQQLYRPGLFVLQMVHDDFCPAIRSQRDADCRPPCRPDFYLVEPFAGQEGAHQ